MKYKRSAGPTVQVAGSPSKEVRFASDNLLFKTSRQSTEREAWSFYWFEMHCRDCSQCQYPYSVYKRGEHLCQKGEALARDMSLHVYMRDGQIYEHLDRSYGEPDRVEIPHNYVHLRGQLKAMERMEAHARRRHRRTVTERDPVTGEQADGRRREDRYYDSRGRREEPKAEKRVEKSHHAERADHVVESLRAPPKVHKVNERTDRTRDTQDAEIKRKEERAYFHETKPRKETKYHGDEARGKEKPHRKANERGGDIQVAIAGREKKYRTELVKPDKEYRQYYR